MSTIIERIEKLEELVSIPFKSGLYVYHEKSSKHHYQSQVSIPFKSGLYVYTCDTVRQEGLSRSQSLLNQGCMSTSQDRLSLSGYGVSIPFKSGLYVY